MTQVRVYKTPNRLAKVVTLPGGKTVAEAVRAADKRVQRVRETSVNSLPDKVAQLAALAEGGRADPVAALDGLYTIANQIYGLAGVFGLDAVAEAAFGLCDLAERFSGEAPVNWQAIDVHVNGIRLLAAGAGQGADIILTGLREVRARLIEAG